MKLYDFEKWEDKKNRSIQLVDGKCYEPLFEETFSNIKKGWSVIDVGAGVGYYTIKAGLKVGEEGKVLSIEPHPQVFHILRMNINLYNLTNVIPVRKAVSDKTGKVNLYEGRTGAGSTLLPVRLITINRITKFPKFLRYVKNRETIEKMRRIKKEVLRRLSAVEIEIDTLDRIVKENGIETVNLIKMDIEGVEFKALRGSQSLLKSSEPVLLIEIHNRVDWRPKELFALLESLGYEIEKQQSHNLLIRAVHK